MASDTHGISFVKRSSLSICVTTKVLPKEQKRAKRNENQDTVCECHLNPLSQRQCKLMDCSDNSVVKSDNHFSPISKCS